MLQNKGVQIFLLWVFVILAYIIMGFVMPAINSLVVSANTSIAASANMSNMPGTQEAVRTAPVWLWLIPGFVGIVTTVIKLKFQR